MQEWKWSYWELGALPAGWKKQALSGMHRKIIDRTVVLFCSQDRLWNHQYIWNNINYLYLGWNFYGNNLISVDRRVYCWMYNGNVGRLLMIWIYMKYMLDFILLLFSIPTNSQDFHWQWVSLLVGNFHIIHKVKILIRKLETEQILEYTKSLLLTAYFYANKKTLVVLWGISLFS